MSRRLAIGVALALTLLAFGPLLAPGAATRMRVQLLSKKLDSTDPAVRAQARQDLLAIGRPMIDHVWPELIAGEVQDETTGVTTLVFVGSPRASSGHAEFEVEAVLHADSPYPANLRGCMVGAVGSPVCPTARALLAPVTSRALVVVGYREDGCRGKTELRVAVPLDDDLADATLAAVRRRLAR